MEESLHKFNFTLVSESESVINTPFFKKLTHVDGKLGGSEPVLYVLEAPNGLRHLLEEIYEASDKKIVLDCSLFAQLAIHLDCKIVSKVYLFVIAAPINALSMYDMSLRLCYLRPSNENAFKYLQQSSCIAKGQYLVKTNIENQYMGLGSNGLTIQTIEEWTNELKKGCELWSYISDNTFENRSHKTNFNLPLKGIISIYLKTGKLDSWHIEKDTLGI
jgi:hypothetical protein